MPESVVVATLLRLEEKDSTVSQVEIDEVLGLCARINLTYHLTRNTDKLTVGDEAPEVPPNDAVPCRAFAVIELAELVPIVLQS